MRAGRKKQERSHYGKPVHGHGMHVTGVPDRGVKIISEPMMAVAEAYFWGKRGLDVPRSDFRSRSH